MSDLKQRLNKASRQPGHIAPADMETEVSSQGVRSEIAAYTAATAHMLRPRQPFRVAVPAYEKFTSDGSADNTETFSLTHSVVDSPATQSVVVWLDGEYYGAPDSTDFDADEIDVTDSGTGSNVHVYYISDAPATLELRKSVPASSTDSSQQVYKGNVGLVHGTKQTEQPEYLDLNETPLHAWLGTDMTLTAYIDAPYTVRFEDGDGDGTEPTNALLNVPAYIGQSEVAGLTSAIKQDMSQA
ncbi:hypothetical protein VB773_01445 [Haloarculaceae archaeon H-GB2-1]|nr:hypothetical protein [Haloarculaceae archaeon H-GB1-1]MEA5406378.1 hypothetical protein [Haloarculaceae archaeon H-GB2-1]